jgi:hypothetical protein
MILKFNPRVSSVKYYYYYLDQNGITAKELKFLHGIRMKCDNGVVIVDSLINNETIRRFLPLENRSTEVSFRSLAENTKKKQIRFNEITIEIGIGIRKSWKELRSEKDEEAYESEDSGWLAMEEEYEENWDL